MQVQRDDVMAALRVEDVLNHLGISGQWRGRWMRTARCAETDHGSDAFAVARDGHWHCHSCDKGGDLLQLVALGAGLSIKDDFPAVLEAAAAIAGVDTGGGLFGAPLIGIAPRPRPEPPPQLPLAKRIAIAKQRAAWLWSRLNSQGSLIDRYLRSRAIDLTAISRYEVLRSTPLQLDPEMRQRIESRDPRLSDALRTVWWTMGARRGTLGIAIPVRAVDDGTMVDIRVRRIAPEDGQPKIIGMVGGVTEAPAERGKTRQLVGCYGHPHAIDSDHVVIVEGAMDYLTALQLWPDAHVLGAVNAGSLALVTAHAAAALAARDSTSRLTIVEQCDPPRELKDGRIVAGAADASINEDPNAATKVAIRILRSPARVGWLFCSLDDRLVDGKPVKDLNDLVRVGADAAGMVTWWGDPTA